MNAIWSIASKLSIVFSTSQNKRRRKLSPGGEPQPKLRSTIRRFFSGTKPWLLSGRFGGPILCNLYTPPMLLLNVFDKTHFVPMIGSNHF